MPSNSLALRAEGLITAKLRRDAAAPGPRETLGAETACWGRTVGLRVPALRELGPYNKVRGVNADDLPHLDAMTAFFTDAGIVPTLEVWAGDAGDRLGAHLARRGMYAGAVTSTLYADLSARPATKPSHAAPTTEGRDPTATTDRPHLATTTEPVDPAVTVDELDPADDGTEYFATLLGGYGFASAPPGQLTMLRAEHDPSAVRRYLARVDGRPAAAAGLYLHPDGALLSGAATLPAHRRHGCQSALIARRLVDAAAHTDLAVVTVAHGSPSHANLERAGFHLTHTRTAWRPLDAALAV